VVQSIGCAGNYGSQRTEQRQYAGNYAKISSGSMQIKGMENVFPSTPVQMSAYEAGDNVLMSE
jgi:hypothetical protein